MPTVACPACGNSVATAPDGSTAGPCPGCGRPVPSSATDTLTHTEAALPDAPTLTSPGHAGTLSAAGAPVIPGYTLLGELGRGGMGVVYRAREASLNRTVALKVLLGGAHGGATAVARFRTEAAAAAAVQHRHIVRVFAVGEHGGLPYMAMELVPGGSLAARLERGPLDAAESARVVEAVARGVAAAHANGVLHRDLKPANVLFTADGEPRVADFGLAKVEDTGLTASGAVMGTPAYMAPEQARGDTKSAGPTTDVWALGAILYECLAGRPPFRGAAAPDTLRRVCEADPDPLPRGVPRDLATVALKCLEKESTRRYPSAAAVAEDLARFLAGDPIAARRPSPTVRAARWVGRHRGPVYVAAGALLAAVISVMLLSRKPKPAAPPDPGPVARLPADLAMVPPNGLAFVTLRPADVLGRTEVTKLLNDVMNVKAAVGVEDATLEHVIENFTGVRPTGIERVTLIPGESAPGPDRAPGLLLIVRTTAPVNLKPVRDRLEEFFGTLDARERGGRRLYATKMGELTFALVKAGEHEVAFGHTAEVEAALDRLDAAPTDGPLTPALEAAARGHTVVAGSRSPGEVIGLVEAVDTDFPPDLRRVPAHLRAATATVVTLDLLPPAADFPGPRMDVAARIRFPTEARAAEALSDLRDALRWLGRPDPEPDTAGLGVLLPALRTASREASVRQDGAEVVVTAGARWTAADLAAAARKPVPTLAHRLNAIGLALHAYADTHGHFPPAVIQSAAGRPLYSWRVELLPFLEQDELYRRLNRKEAWDHPDNKALLAEVPAYYAPGPDDPARSGGFTRFQALVGKGGVFDPTAKTNLPAITDGSANTILLVEAGEAVHWAEPKDIEYRPGGPVPKLGNSAADTFLVVLADGSIKTLVRGNVRPADLTALFTRAGNEIVDWARLERRAKGK